MRPNPRFDFKRKEDLVVDAKISNSTLKQARQTNGNLVLAHKHLTSVPDDVWNFNDLTFPDANWWELELLKKLDLSDNEITTIPENIPEQTLKECTHILLKQNRLTIVPPSLFFPSLKMLDLSSNSIEHLPDRKECYGSAEQLIEIRLNSNQLCSIPESFGLLRSLSSLDLSENNLRELPITFSLLSKLISLNLKHNKLISLPDSFGNLTSLENLEIEYNSLTSLPNSFENLNKLTCLSVGFNKLTSLPLIPKKLIEFHAHNNNLRVFPDHICLSSIKILSLSTNKIVAIPNAIQDMNSLIRLDLTNNEIAVLNPLLANLASLSALHLSGNPLKTLKSGLIEKGAIAIKDYLRTRLVEEKETEQSILLSSETANVTGGCGEQIISSSQSLVLSRKQLKEVPQGITDLNYLTSIDLSFNLLSSLPLNFVFPQLENLNLSNNKISSFPEVILKMRKIRKLELSYNSFSNGLPEQFTSSFPDLYILFLRHCQLTTFPQCLLNQNSLEEIDVAENRISVLPVEVSKLTTLRYLDLSGNDLTKLPPELGLLEETLQTLLFEGNAIKTISRSVIEKGTKAVLLLLKNRIPT